MTPRRLRLPVTFGRFGYSLRSLWAKHHAPLRAPRGFDTVTIYWRAA